MTTIKDLTFDKKMPTVELPVAAVCWKRYYMSDELTNQQSTQGAEPTLRPLTGIERRNAALRPCKPGEVRNKKGINGKYREQSEIARQIAMSKRVDVEYEYPKNGKMIISKNHLSSDKTIGFSIVFGLAKEAIAGNVAAIKEWLDRTDGRVTEKHAIDVGFSKKSNEELLSLVESIVKKE